MASTDPWVVGPAPIINFRNYKEGTMNYARDDTKHFKF
jgi:hypothetical protein